MTTSNVYGRQVVVPLTNKSSGSVAKGDVVIVDTTNNDAFTTTTSASFTGVIGIAQETIANNVTGRVLMAGYADLVNVPSSVTRGHYCFTHTVAKQATGSASRATGAFGQFLTGGTTPEAHIFGITDSSVTGLADPMTTRGDIIIRNASNVTAKLGVGAAGEVLRTDGTDVSWGQPAARGAKVYHNTTQSTSDSTDLAVTYNSEDDDTNANHDTSSNQTKIILNKVGRWRLTATHVFAASATGARFGYFKVNGTAVRGKAKIPAASVGETWVNYTTTVVATAITDYAEAWAIQTSGGSLNLAADCTFEAYFIGT